MKRSRYLLAMVIVFTVSFSLLQPCSHALYSAAATSVKLTEQESLQQGGQKSVLAIGACSAGYMYCLDATGGSWWGTIICSGSWLGCIALA